mgnify:CR=1 FL=1
MNTDTQHSYDISEKFPVVYHEDSDMFTGEASSMRLSPGQWPERITLYNSNSGNEVEYVRADSESNEGDLKSVTYLPMTLNGLISAFSEPQNAHLKLVIFND